jgi:ATP-dependent Clp protease protease subunit
MVGGTKMSFFDDIFDEKIDDTHMDLVNKKFFKENTLFFDENVRQEGIGTLCKQILSIARDNNKPITIYLNTDGGDVYEFFRLYDVIQSISNKVHIIGQARLFSAGAWIVACAATGNRFCYPNSSFMLHQVSSVAIGKLTDIQNDFEETKRLQDNLISLLKKHTKLSDKDFEQLMHKDFYFDAKTAKKLGVVDKILK